MVLKKTTMTKSRYWFSRLWLWLTKGTSVAPTQTRLAALFKYSIVQIAGKSLWVFAHFINCSCGLCYFASFGTMDRVMKKSFFFHLECQYYVFKSSYELVAKSDSEGVFMAYSCYQECGYFKLLYCSLLANILKLPIKYQQQVDAH